MVDSFYEEHPGVLQYQEDQIAFARKHAYVLTHYNRPLYVPAILSEGWLGHSAEKQAINFPIQAGLMEEVKDAMLRCPEYLIFNVHDELLWLLADGLVEEYIHYLREQLAVNTNGWRVPYPWDIKVGKNWGEIKHIPFTMEVE